MTPKGKRQGLLTLEDFELDEQGRMLRCPEGHAPTSTYVSRQRLQATFDRSICNDCALFSRCPAVAARKHQRWQYTHERVRQRARRLSEQTTEFKERYRWRAGAEGTMSRLKHQMGMGKLRVRGKSAITYTTNLRALGLNIFRVVSWKKRMAQMKVIFCLPFTAICSKRVFPLSSRLSIGKRASLLPTFCRPVKTISRVHPFSWVMFSFLV